MTKETVHVQNKCNFFPNIFCQLLVEAMDMELMDMEGQLYFIQAYYAYLDAAGNAEPKLSVNERKKNIRSYE
jgi:hypothetical protein